jgi:hypothetical protein
VQRVMESDESLVAAHQHGVVEAGARDFLEEPPDEAVPSQPEPAWDGRSCPSCWRYDRVGDARVLDALESALTEIVALWRPHEPRESPLVPVSG